MLAASWAIPALLEPAESGPLIDCDFELYPGQGSMKRLLAGGD
jgi:hypothetical protein